MLQKLAPLPTTAHPDFHNDRFDKQKPVWVNAVGNYEISAHDPTDHFIASMFSNPARFCDMCTVETRYADPEMYEIGNRWMEMKLEENTLTSLELVSEMSSAGRVLAHFGKGNEMGMQIVNQINCCLLYTSRCV